MFRKNFFAWCWRERKDYDPQGDYLRPLGSSWEVWNKRKNDRSPGLGDSVAFIRVFENESAAKAGYEHKKSQVVYDGGTVALWFVKAYTQKGAAESAMTGTGECIDWFHQNNELARELSIAKQLSDSIEEREKFLKCLRRLELQNPHRVAFELDQTQQPFLQAREIKRHIDGYVLRADVTEDEVLKLMAHAGYPYYRVRLDQAHIIE